jgi:hypothetical protein
MLIGRWRVHQQVRQHAPQAYNWFKNTGERAHHVLEAEQAGRAVVLH